MLIGNRVSRFQGTDRKDGVSSVAKKDFSARSAWGMSADQVEDFYMRWREWMLVAWRHGAWLIGNNDHADFFKDMGDRLKEDAWWYASSAGFDIPMMMFRESVPYDNLYFWTEDRGVMTPRELLGPTGFGRLRIAAPTRQGSQSWEQFDDKGQRAPIITPDEEGKPIVSEDDDPYVA